MMLLPNAPWTLIVSMDVDPAYENLFNEVYDNEHIPALVKVPGVLSIVRWRKEKSFVMQLAGNAKTFEFPDEPRYSTAYGLENPNVVDSAEWAEAVELGRWGEEVRPFTSNRRHVLFARL